MTGISAEYQENFEVSQIIEADLTPITRKIRISEVKKSFSHKKKNSSIRTIFNLANTMVGSSIVIFPNLFQKAGVITSLIVLIVIGCISCKTCLLEITHFKLNELDFTDAILRILGKKWFYFYNFVSILLLFVSGIIYFLLIAKMGYSFLTYIFLNYDIAHSLQSDVNFNEFSYQYFGIITISLSLLLFSLKNLKIILKLGQYGIISIMIFSIYVIVKGILNISSIDFNINDLTSASTSARTPAPPPAWPRPAMFMCRPSVLRARQAPQAAGCMWRCTAATSRLNRSATSSTARPATTSGPTATGSSSFTRRSTSRAPCSRPTRKARSTRTAAGIGGATPARATPTSPARK